MNGAEYLTASVLQSLWQDLDSALGLELSESKCGVQEFLKRRNAAWNLVGRVHFNLAENRKDDAAPFAFLATYTTRLSAHAKAQHLPLGQALGEYAGAANKDRLLSLLLPVQRASESCSWLKAMVDAGEIFHPLRWRPSEAMQLLRDVPQLESAGVVVRMPATWQANRPPRPQVTAKVGGKLLSGVGQDALLDFRMDVRSTAKTLTPAEVRELLAKSDGLALVRGRSARAGKRRILFLEQCFWTCTHWTGTEVIRCSRLSSALAFLGFCVLLGGGTLLSCFFYAFAGLFHEAGKAVRQFANAVRLPSFDRLSWDQLRADTHRGRSRQNEIDGCLLVHTTCRDQRNLGQRRVQRLDVLISANLGTREDLHEVGTGPPSRYHFGRSECPWQDCEVFLRREFHNLEVESGSGQKACTRVHARPCCLGIQDRTGADYHLWMVVHEVGNQFNGSGHRHGDFHDRYSATCDSLGGEMRFFAGTNFNRRDNTYLFDEGTDFVFRHWSESFTQGAAQVRWTAAPS
jgi:hypothetical protein